MLFAAILIMGLSTTAIGPLPTHHGKRSRSTTGLYASLVQAVGPLGPAPDARHGVDWSGGIRLSFFLVLKGGNLALVSAAIIVSAGIVHPVIFAAEASFVPELFETQVRFTGASLGKQIGTVIGGGLAPLMATSLIGWSDEAIAPIILYFGEWHFARSLPPLAHVKAPGDR